MLEDMRVMVKGRTCYVGGLVKGLNGERIAPWIYLVSWRNLPKLLASVGKRARVTVTTT